MKEALTTMEFEFDSEDDAKVVYGAVVSEVLSSPSDRAAVDLSLEVERIIFHIKAKDKASLRASLSSCLRWIGVSHGICELE